MTVFHLLGIDWIVSKNGGFREKNVLYDSPHHFERGRWDDEHKVVYVVSDYIDDDGHRDSFAVDLVTMRICG